MATRKRKSTPSMGTLLLVTATEAEAIFFSQMRKDCRFANLTVMYSGAKTLHEHIAFTSKAKFKNRFDNAYALFGFDDVNTTISEVKEAEVVTEDLENSDVKPENATEAEIVEEKVSGEDNTEREKASEESNLDQQ